MMRKRANQIATYGICWAARCLRMVVPIVAVALPAMCLGQSYIVTDLGKLGGNFATGIGINSSGQVVGESAYAFVPFASHVHAFLSNGGPVMDIGAIGGNNTFNSSAQDINDSGVIVGASEGVGFSEHAFVYANGVMQDLGTLGGGQSNARAINNAGQIVGYADLPSSGFLRHAFLYDNGVMHDLGTLGGPSVRLSAATDINSFGKIVGSSYLAGPEEISRAFLYDGGTMKDLGTIGGNSSAATAINDNDVIVGHGATVTTGNGLRHAFRYSNGIMSDLGTLGGDTSFARDINSIGEIVGESNYPGGGSLNHAFVIRDGVMHDLNSLIDSATGWTLFAANAINDASQITGAGTINGEWHAYLLTPVPEPRGILFAAFGFAAVAKAFYHRHRRGIHDI